MIINQILKQYLLTEKEVSAAIGYSKAWLKKKRFEKKGPPYIRMCANGKIYYEKTALEKWVKENIIENE